MGHSVVDFFFYLFHISFPLTLYSSFHHCIIFFPLLSVSFSSFLQIASFPCKILYIQSILFDFQCSQKRKGIENASQIQQINNILIAGTSLKCLYETRHTTDCHLYTLPRTSQFDDLDDFLLKWMVPFLPNSACLLSNFLEPRASSTAFLLGKVWWPWRGAGGVDSSALKLMINPEAGQQSWAPLMEPLQGIGGPTLTGSLWKGYSISLYQERLQQNQGQREL